MIKKGDTVYVIADCRDALKRQSGTCWFQESGGCPYREDGKLEYCGERETILDVFERVVDYVNYPYEHIRIRGFDFRQFDPTVPFRMIEKRVFMNRPDAIAALERMERERERKRQERKQAALIVPGQCRMFVEA